MRRLWFWGVPLAVLLAWTGFVAVMIAAFGDLHSALRGSTYSGRGNAPNWLINLVFPGVAASALTMGVLWRLGLWPMPYSDREGCDG